MARFRHYVCRATAFGTTLEGAEEWSTGFYMGLADADTPDPTQASADQFLTRWQTFFTNANSRIWTGCKTVGVRFTKLNKEDGKTLPNFNFYAYPAVPFAGGNAGGPLPPQITLVASLTARPNNGLGSKGRMYLPGINTGISNSGKIGDIERGTIADNLATMFNALNDDADVPGQLINASKGRALQLLGDMPVNRYVQDIKIGNVYDTQRRRRNQLDEVYTSREITLD